MSTASGKNPYRPGVGTRPLHLAGREAELRRFASVLRAAPEIPANMRLTGLRGVGKTVLLSEFKRAAESSGWLASLLELQPRHNREDILVDVLRATCREAGELVSRAARLRAKVGKARRAVGPVELGYGDVSVTLNVEASRGEQDLARALAATTEQAIEADHPGFVLLLDEAQVIRDERARDGEHPLSILISSVSAVQRAERSFGLVLCGLPTLASNLLQARSYAERMFRGEEIGSLDTDAARAAFVEPLRETGVSSDEDLVEAVLDSVEGYPYFIQLWGAELWDAAQTAGTDRLTLTLLGEIQGEILRRLDLDFYDPRIQTLTPAEQDVLVASADCPYPPLRVSDLNKRVSKTPANVNVLLGRLVEAGVIYRVRKGEYRYTAPKFFDYLGRRVAKLETE